MVGLGHPESAVNRVNRELTTFSGLTVREYRTIPTRGQRCRNRSLKRPALCGKATRSRPRGLCCVAWLQVGWLAHPQPLAHLAATKRYDRTSTCRFRILRWPTNHLAANSRSSRRNGKPHHPGLRPRSIAMCLPPTLRLRVIGTPASPRTCFWWRPSAAPSPGPRQAQSSAGSPVQGVELCRSERHYHRRFLGPLTPPMQR